MTAVFRQIVASATALSVLACGIVCACPTRGAGTATKSTQKAPAHQHSDQGSHQVHGHGEHPEAAGKPHPEKSTKSRPCHTPAAPVSDTGGEAPAIPCDHDGGGGSCGHCDSTAIVKVEQNPVPFFPHLVPAFFSAFVADRRMTAADSRPPTIAFDLPPPAEWSTLLRLHCALII